MTWGSAVDRVFGGNIDEYIKRVVYLAISTKNDDSLSKEDKLKFIGAMKKFNEDFKYDHKKERMINKTFRCEDGKVRRIPKSVIRLYVRLKLPEFKYREHGNLMKSFVKINGTFCSRYIPTNKKIRECYQRYLKLKEKYENER